MLLTLKRILKNISNVFPKNKYRSDYNKLMERLKFLEGQVDNSAKQLEIAKSSFLKNIYHEIRTPLNAIMGFTNLLNREHLLNEKEREEYVNLLNNSSRDFLTKIDDIIQASLLEAKMINIDQEACNLYTFLNDNHSFFSIRKHNANKNNVALLLSIDEELKHKEVFIDRFRIAQVLTQFIDNALKYTEKGIVEYGCMIKDGVLEFFVKDNSVEDLKGSENFLFNRFTKIKAIDEQRPGLGLGLAISKELVTLMNGEIWFSPNKDRSGNTFYFNIPLFFTKPKRENSVNVNNRRSRILLGKKQSYLAV